MAQPTPYERAYNFADYQADNPADPLPGNQVDAEYNRVKVTLDQVLANLRLIQNDDTTLKNASVGLEQLSTEVTVGFTVPTAWVTAHSYVASPASTVFHGVIFYRCLISHTSGTFSTDLSADKWEEIADFSSVSQNASLIVYDNDGTSLSAETIQEAIDELWSEKLDKAGGTMSGVINMGSHKITSVTNPTSAQDAATKNYAETWSAKLASFAGLTAAASKIAYFVGTNTLDVTDFTSKARDLVAGVDAAAMRTTLGLGSLSTASTINNGDWSGTDLAVANGGTGGSDAATARTNLGLGALATLGYTDLVYTGTTSLNATFPIGTTLLVHAGSEAVRNAVVTVKTDGGNTGRYLDTGGGTALTGTWNARGAVLAGGEIIQMVQRTA